MARSSLLLLALVEREPTAHEGGDEEEDDEEDEGEEKPRLDALAPHGLLELVGRLLEQALTNL